MESKPREFIPQDTVKAAVNGSLLLGGAGLAVSAIQNALVKRNIGPWGVFTRSGGIIVVFAAAGGTYEFARCASANLRERNDSLNPAIGGFLAGSILGLRYGTTAGVLGMGALCATVLGTADYTGGFRGFKKDHEIDDFERKQYLRKNRRRPIEETIAEVGEGRGIYAPGWEERRAQRIKEKYGIDVPGRA